MTDKPNVWMPPYIGDYRQGTARLTRDQHGGYLLLIMDYWDNGPPRDDDAELASIVLASPREWKALRPKLERFFTVVDGRWRHKRVHAELESWTARKARFAERAAAGGRAKAAKTRAAGRASSSLEAVLADCPSPSPLKEEGSRSPSSLQPGGRGPRAAEGAAAPPVFPEPALRAAVVEHQAGPLRLAQRRPPSGARSPTVHRRPPQPRVRPRVQAAGRARGPPRGGDQMILRPRSPV